MIGFPIAVNEWVLSNNATTWATTNAVTINGGFNIAGGTFTPVPKVKSPLAWLDDETEAVCALARQS